MNLCKRPQSRTHDRSTFLGSKARETHRPSPLNFSSLHNAGPRSSGQRLLALAALGAGAFAASVLPAGAAGPREGARPAVASRPVPALSGVVRDASGATPLIYQGAYLNPAGRTISLGLRKLFY